MRFLFFYFLLAGHISMAHPSQPAQTTVGQRSSGTKVKTYDLYHFFTLHHITFSSLAKPKYLHQKALKQ